ncbi:zf-HC2 domain-containing protein [Myxococcus sp. K15C18031901]|uniref:anti-sigma factor family protein n=1 Tax=Myxococcus dinghuensis TaxID=2906761 RepID=UPI0020A6FA86|nr:zf-HC2 domain-containing protein [Myxococcus dinghuensis]MCP3100761.1 zf-HC2 domain-containing protein [Myxococcus dinghuensis]
MEACSPEWQERLSAWFDGECQAHEQREVERHLSRCVGCTREASRYVALREALQLHAAAGARAPSRPMAPVRHLTARPRPAPRRWPVAAGVALALAAAGIAWSSRRGAMNDALAMDLERHHLKAFSRTMPCEFESSDPSAVRAWVEREVGYAVQVPQVPDATLLGARRCTLHGQLSASLLYRHEQGKAMTLFLPPPGSPAAREAVSFAGGGTRCMSGPVGERICVAPREGGRAALVVSEMEASVLVDALARLAQ